MKTRKVTGSVLPTLLVFALLKSWTPSVLAQDSTPDPSAELRREQEEADRRRALAIPATPTAPKDLRAPDETRLLTEEAPCFHIREVRLGGNEKGLFDWVLSELDGPAGNDSPMGRCLGVQSIEILQKRLQNAIISRGHVTSRVLISNQNLSEGVLVFEPVAGRIDRLLDTSTPSGSVSLATAMPGKAGDLLNLRDIEQALDNLQRVPTATADLQIVPGQTPGRSDIALSWEQSSRWRLGLSLDDAGSDTTGRYQAGATLSADNPLGMSDLAYLSLSKGFGGSRGPSPKGTQTIAAHYSIPVGYWLYKANISHNTYEQTVIGAFDAYRYSGQSDSVDLGIDRVLLRDNRQILTALGSLQRRASRNHIDDTEILVQRRVTTSLEAGLTHRLYAGNSVIQSTMSHRQGIKALGSLPAPEEAFGEGTSRYRLTTAGVNVQWPWRMAEQSLRYTTSLRLQKHHTRLAPQERFSIGGRYSVRGFDNNASLVAESGAVWRNELVWNIHDMPYAVPYIGLDHGRVSGPSAINLPGSSLVGAVLGLRGQINGFQYEFFYGRPVSKPAELNASTSVWGFALYQSY